MAILNPVVIYDRYSELIVVPPNSAIAEIGIDMGHWKFPKHFASWMGLCFGTKVSSGKIAIGTVLYKSET